MGSRSRLLLITAVVIVVVVASVLLAPPRIFVSHGVKVGNTKTSGFSTANQGVVGLPISLNIPIYVVGPSTLVQRLVSAGINQSLIKPVTVNELPSLPGNSLVVIDWSVIGPGLITNVSGLVHVNVNSTNFKLIRELIKRGDFVVIHGNASEVSVIELVLAVAWSRAYNTSIIAIPVPKYLNGLDYVIAYGNNKVLVIGPHSLSAALNIASKFWTPIITKTPTPDPSDDLCAELSVSATKQPSQISSTAYAIVYGQQSYEDSLGNFVVDFCLSWSVLVYNDYNGYSAGYAELYNYIAYSPFSGTQIEYLKSFQDALASYVVYEYEMGYISASQLPGDVEFIAGSGGGYEPGYWTNTAGADPHAQTCTQSTSYGISLATGFSTSGTGITVSNSVSTTYSCPEYTISLYGQPAAVTPLGPSAYNQTWVFTPQSTQYAEQEQIYGVESEGYTYMGPAYNPQSSAYTIPAGSSVVVNETNGCTYYLLGFIPISGTLVEHIAYDINWDVWVNSNVAMTSYSSGAYIVPPAASGWSSSNGFYYTTSCWLG
ncbi:hypothetical protein [Vulcanisaeta souniana]|nr:hypothetical protein [Vulcanisaeta souniana]GGI69508.1 hypothetical protein GCM10007112_03120 [Vulcanisaeta souniana JCM 11219]